MSRGLLAADASSSDAADAVAGAPRRDRADLHPRPRQSRGAAAVRSGVRARHLRPQALDAHQLQRGRTAAVRSGCRVGTGVPRDHDRRVRDLSAGHAQRRAQSLGVGQGLPAVDHADGAVEDPGHAAGRRVHPAHRHPPSARSAVGGDHSLSGGVLDRRDARQHRLRRLRHGARRPRVLGVARTHGHHRGRQRRSRWSSPRCSPTASPAARRPGG